MPSWLIPMALSIIFDVLKLVVKNPDHKEAMKAALVKLGKAIIAAYPDEFPSL